MNTLNDKNIELIKRTVVETVSILMSDPDFGLTLKPAWKKGVAKRIKTYKKSELVPFFKIKNRFANA